MLKPKKTFTKQARQSQQYRCKFCDTVHEYRKKIPAKKIGTVLLQYVFSRHDQDLIDSIYKNDPNGNNNPNLSDRNTENPDRNQLDDGNK